MTHRPAPIILLRPPTIYPRLFVALLLAGATTPYSQPVAPESDGSSDRKTVERDAQYIAAVPPPFFLIPQPASPARVGMSSPREMVFLFTAPLLDRDRIEALGLRMETRSRELLESRQRRVADRLCRAGESSGTAMLEAYRREMVRQRDLWGRTQNRFEAMQRARIKNLLPAFSHTDILKLRQTVAELQRERQDLVQAAWREFFDDLEGDLDDCDPPGDYVQLPRERLHPPVFLARYYFFRRIPARLRIKFTS